MFQQKTGSKAPRFPKESFYDSISALKTSRNATRVPIEQVVHCNWTQPTIQFLHPSAIAWKYTGDVKAVDLEDDDASWEFDYMLRRELRNVIDNDVSRKLDQRDDGEGNRSVDIHLRKPELDLEIDVQIQTQSKTSKKPLALRREKLAVCIVVTDTSEGEKDPRRVYCCGVARCARLGRMFGIHGSKDLQPKNFGKGLREKMKKIVRGCKWKKEKVWDDEKQALLGSEF